MLLDYYNSGKSSGTRSRELDYAGLIDALKEPRLKQLTDAFRAGDAEAKKLLPAICYMGKSVNGQRKAEYMQPTGLIMIDVDHCQEPRKCYDAVVAKLPPLRGAGRVSDLLLAHITPSGKGLRLVFRNLKGYNTIEENQKAIADALELSKFGDLDTACKDLSRISFLPSKENFLDISPHLFEDGEIYLATPQVGEEAKPALEGQQEIIFDDDTHEYDDYRFQDHTVKEIIETWCNEKWPKDHRPPQGSVHLAYNQMILNFRNMCDNDPIVLYALLPRFGHKKEECQNQCKSMCRINHDTKFPNEFYWFLVHHGYYKDPAKAQSEADEVAMEDADPYARLNELIDAMPELPPVFREFVKVAPRYFKIPTVIALLPILGTLASYLSAVYMNGDVMTTTFFSFIYAPASSGKSFARRLYDVLTKDLKDRDMVSSAREMLYNNTYNRKGANEKAPEDPHVMMRLMPAINSQPELLIKMRNNKGYHMLTFIEEMDTWIKGMKAQGNDKNDMARVSFDNGEYGQAYKSTGTFKGVVKLYWNVLATGTPNQLFKYFKDVENGMVTRCNYCDLGDQRFADFPIWDKMSKHDEKVIERFMTRCDENCYMEPLDFDVEKLYEIKDEDFDQLVPWKQETKPRQLINLSWIYPVLIEWLNKQGREAKQGINDAQDTFRRRVAVRGFRLALLCYSLYPGVGTKAKQIIINFVKWFMDVDLYNIMKVFGDKYNEATAEGETKNVARKTLYDQIPDQFDAKQLQQLSSKLFFKTPAGVVISIWKKAKLIEKVGDGVFAKVKN